MMRAAASPATNAAFGRMNSLMDAREVLPLIRVPTLVLDRADARLPKGPVDMPPLEEARYAADRIPGATLKVLPGRDYLPWVGDQDSIVAEVGRFVTGAAPVREADRVLLTVLFTDIVATRRSALPSSGTSVGASYWSGTTLSCVATSRSTAGRRSIAPVTAS